MSGKQLAEEEFMCEMYCHPCEQLKQQKPTVTREQIRDIIIDIDKAVKATPINYLVSNDLKIATNVLSEWLKVHGIEVMK